jgi:hypothetical protein
MEDCRQRQFCRRILGSGEDHVRKGAMMTKIESFQGFDDHLSRQPARGLRDSAWAMRRNATLCNRRNQLRGTNPKSAKMNVKAPRH